VTRVAHVAELERDPAAKEAAWQLGVKYVYRGDEEHGSSAGGPIVGSDGGVSWAPWVVSGGQCTGVWDAPSVQLSSDWPWYESARQGSLLWSYETCTVISIAEFGRWSMLPEYVASTYQVPRGNVSNDVTTLFWSV
jgi:hypothetical protein